MKKKMAAPKLTPSGRYRIQLMVKGQKVSITDADPARCQARAAAMRADILAGMEQRRQEQAGRITLGAAIDAYIADRSNVLSPSTIYNYKRIRKNYFQSLMTLNVCDLDERDLQRAVNEEAEHVGAKTIRNILGLVLAATASYKEIDTRRIKLPQRKKKEHAILDESGMIELMEGIRGNVAEVPILLGVWLGMRRSEIMGLCWDSVDFEARQIRVQRTYVRDADGKGYVLRDEMKTEASRRVLDCPGYILAKLAALQPNKTKRQGQIFHIHPNTIYSAMKRVCEAHGIPFVGVHGLRHTNASVMASLDVIDRVTMALGGWSTDVTMKQVYQHVFRSDQQDAVAKRDAFFAALAEGDLPDKKK